MVWRLPAALAGLCLFLYLLGLPAAIRAQEDQGALLPRGYGPYSIWQQGIFRIKFMREGDEAVPPADVNGNNCPDFVEDVAAQLMTAYHIFCTVSGFPSPLDSPRYKGVRYIDVTIRDRGVLRGLNGIAFGAVSLRPDPTGATLTTPDNELPKIPVLIIGLSRSIDPKKNPTPAHEFFHQIQNGMAYSKNPWLYEGMAAYSEDALRRPSEKGAQRDPRQTLTTLANDSAYRDTVFKSSYGTAADLVWRPLAALCPGASVSFSPRDPALNRTYSDGSPVLRNQKVPGTRMMRRVLERLGEVEAIAFDRFAYKKWTEAKQRRPENNEFIVDALLHAAGELCPQ